MTFVHIFPTNEIVVGQCGLFFFYDAGDIRVRFVQIVGMFGWFLRDAYMHI